MWFKKMFYLVLFIMTISSHAQVQTVVCQGTSVNAYTRVEAPTLFKDRLALRKISTTNFIVDYDEGNYYVPQDAREAFDYAVEIWSHLLTASKPIKIKVEFHAYLQGANSLAETQIATYRNNIATAQHANTQYAIALAKQIDQNVNYTNYDMTIFFKSGVPWNYETNGIPITDHYDFVSVALHEIEHGLGFSGSMYIESGVGGFGFSGYANNSNGTYPKVYDRYGISGSQRLIDVTNSTTLINLLTGGNVFFDGSSAKLANNNANVKLYAPSEWSRGTSFSHLDETTFSSGNQNSLMSASINYAEVIHSPGEIGLGILKDLGWQVNRMISFSRPLSSAQIVKGQNYMVKWFDNITQPGDYLNFELYKITTGDPMPLGDINTSLVPSNPGWTNNNLTWLVNNTLENGYYFLRAVGYNHAVDYGQSSVFIISDVPESPHFNPPGTQYPGPIAVQLYTNSPVSEIRYVIGNAEPNQNSTLYTTPIPVPNNTRIRAKSFLVLANNVKVASPISDADYFISSNSFVIEKLTTTNQYGNYRRLPNNSFGQELDVLKVGINNTTDNAVYRSFAKWTNFRSVIPNGSIIQSVEFEIPFNPFYSTASVEFRYYNPSYWDNNWEHIGNGNPVATLPANSMTFNIQAFVPVIQNIINGVGSDYFGIGIKNANENSTTDFVNTIYPIKIRVYYRGNIEISQLNEDNQQFGQVGYWNGTYWEDKNVPATMFKSGDITLKSDQNYISGTTQKYQKWLNQSDVINHITFTIASGVNYFTAKFSEATLSPIIKNYLVEYPTFIPQTDKIWLRDPWFIDELDGTYGMRNQGMSGGNQGIPGANWYERNSPINFSSPDFSNYKGVFLDQNPDPNNPDKPYYSVKAESPQQVILYNTGVTSGRLHNFYFQNWGGTSVNYQNANALETGVVFTNENAVSSAYLKGTQLSNQTDAFDNSNQRRFVATSFNDPEAQCNVQHLVYESMDRVWYEYKYMFPGEYWTLAEPFFYGNAKNPSIDYFDNWVAIVYQEQAASGYKIILRFMVDGNETGLPIEVFHESDDNYNNDADPIVAIGTDITGGDPNNIVVGWKRSSNSNNRSAGYYFKFATRAANGTITWKYGSDFSPKYHFLTNLNSVNGAVSITKKFSSASSSYLKYNFVFEQQDNTGNGSIVYAPMYYDNSLTTKFGFSPKSVVSYGNGYTSNTHPSIISVLDTSARITWLGFRETEEEFWKLGEIEKSKTESGFYHTFFSDPGYPNHFWDFGNEVFSPTINKLTLQGNEGALQKYYLAWSEGEGARNYIVDNSLNRNNIQQLNTSGKNIQLSNGFQYSSAGKVQYSMSLNSDNLPYYFTSSQNVSALFNKPSILSTSSGREGIVSKGNAHFYFVIGDILVNNEEIDFVQIPDTARIASLVDLNEHLISEPFLLNNNSSFVYSVQYGTLDTASANTALASDAEVSFKVELIDAISGEVLGVYDEVFYNLFNLVKYTNVAYSVSSSGIGERLVRVRLVVGSNLDATYSVSERYSTESILPKNRYKEIGFQGKLGVTEYALEQNYPNPFNPVTTIRYQIPKAGRVTLKVYDILGKEITTLVNEEKETGRYTVNFDASNLSSGVYLYEIVVNDYRAVKKLMVIK